MTDHIRPLATRAFVVDDIPCPGCGQISIIGLLLCNERESHVHTWYVCTFWRSGIDPGGGGPYKPCGWTGWVVR